MRDVMLFDIRGMSELLRAVASQAVADDLNNGGERTAAVGPHTCACVFVQHSLCELCHGALCAK